MTETFNHKLTLDLWAFYTIKEWLAKLRELNIGSSGQLAASFEANVVTSAGGDLEKIIFAFDYYGKMVDLGVGKGVSLDIRDSLISSGLTKRNRKEWYKQFYHELAVLKFLYAEKYAMQMNNTIVNTLSDKT